MVSLGRAVALAAALAGSSCEPLGVLLCEPCDGPCGEALACVQGRCEPEGRPLCPGLRVYRFTAEPAAVLPGRKTRVGWQVIDAVRVVLAEDGGALHYDGPALEHQLEIAPSRSTRLVLSAHGAAGTVRRAELHLEVGAAGVCDGEACERSWCYAAPEPFAALNALLGAQSAGALRVAGVVPGSAPSTLLFASTHEVPSPEPAQDGVYGVQLEDPATPRLETLLPLPLVAPEAGFVDLPRSSPTGDELFFAARDRQRLLRSAWDRDLQAWGTAQPLLDEGEGFAAPTLWGDGRTLLYLQEGQLKAARRDDAGGGSQFRPVEVEALDVSGLRDISRSCDGHHLMAVGVLAPEPLPRALAIPVTVGETVTLGTPQAIAGLETALQGIAEHPDCSTLYLHDGRLSATAARMDCD